MIKARAVVDATSVAAHYDDLDPFYRSIWGNHLHHGYWITGKESAEEAVLNLTQLIAREAEIQPGYRICDIGCGYGASAMLFAREYEAEVIGLTISERQYRFAKAGSAGDPRVDFLLRDGMTTLLPGASFDGVVIIESSEHMPDKSGFFAEAFRLLRPGRRLAGAAWLTREDPRAWEAEHLLEPICREGRLPSLASASEYRSMLQEAGFVDIRFTDQARRVRRTWRICALRLLKNILRDPVLRHRLRNPQFTNRVFAKTVFRIWLAYSTGSLRYGIFSALKQWRD